MRVGVLMLVAFALVATALGTGQSDEVAVVPVPHRDTEFYSMVITPTDAAKDEFFSLSYDSTSFTPSSAPYGLADPQNRWECPYNKLSAIAATSRDLWPANKDLLLRRMMDLPAGVSALEVSITAHKAVAVYLNGEAVSGNGVEATVTPGGLCAGQNNVKFNIPDRYVRTGPNLLGIHVKGDTELNYFDIQIRAFYPRPTGDAGNVYTWGKGYYGVLGNGYEEDSFVPGRILDLKELKGEALKKVELGVAHTVLLTEAGKVYTWGRGKEAQLGAGEDYMEVPLSPAGVTAIGVVSDVAAGSLHNLVVDGQGAVHCFGDNTAYQCGLGADDDDRVTEPQRLADLEDEVVVLVGAKDMQSCAVTDQGRIYVWGNKRDKSPRLVDTITGVKQVAVGSRHVLVLTEQGAVYAFGEGAEGQLGLKDGSKEADKPILVEALKGVTVASVVAGSDNSFAITNEGKVYVWGGGSFGKNGLGVWAPQYVPVQVTALGDHKIRGVGAGMTSTLFLTDKGEVFWSGANLRDGSHIMTPSMWASASDKYFTHVYASHLHFAAMTRPSAWDWTKVDKYYHGTMKP
jgi:alpha-tubulin suppressor-like RCC1 family protein